MAVNNEVPESFIHHYSLAPAIYEALSKMSSRKDSDLGIACDFKALPFAKQTDGNDSAVVLFENVRFLEVSKVSDLVYYFMAISNYSSSQNEHEYLVGFVNFQSKSDKSTINSFSVIPASKKKIERSDAT
jgi:hypothetical protein